jgi:type II pantothenate kinase
VAEIGYNPGVNAAIDFGITNIDLVADAPGGLRRWTWPAGGEPDEELVRALLARGGVTLAEVEQLAVTGGRHKSLPAQIDHCRLVSVGEIPAIGRGGQALAEELGAPHTVALLVVSAGSGTAVVAARGDEYRHITGSGVGGGTLLGLSRLILGTVDPAVIDAWAQAGDPNGADLALSDVISGPIGSLPPDATAVNFGRLGKYALTVKREDLAAALVTLVGQVIGVTAINAARAQQTERIIVTGHMLDMPSFRRALERTGEFYSTHFLLPAHPGYATALGALRHLAL